MIDKHFVGAATSDVDYSHAEEAKGKWETRWLEDVLGQTEMGAIHQGIYAATSSGRFLGKLNGGWPLHDPEVTLQGLRRAIERYEAMPVADRVLQRQLNADRDRVRWKREEVLFPPGGLALRSVIRARQDPRIDPFDIRHADRYMLDALWLTQDEWRSFLPASLEPGAETPVDPELAMRLLDGSHLHVSKVTWFRARPKEARITSRVQAVEGKRVALRFQGEFEAVCDTQWNKSRYQGRLLGQATYDRKTDAVVAFEAVALGRHALQELKPNLHKGGVKETVEGAVITLDPSPPERRMLPHEWERHLPGR